MLAAIVDRAPLDHPEFERWRSDADQALAAARLQRDAALYNWACFAAEQCAQLGVKGLLHGLGRGPWGHDFLRLGELLVQAGVDVPTSIADAMRRLGRHYIAPRYPNAHVAGPAGPHYGAADAAEAIADAESILAFVDASWKGLGG